MGPVQQWTGLPSLEGLACPPGSWAAGLKRPRRRGCYRASSCIGWERTTRPPPGGCTPGESSFPPTMPSPSHQHGLSQKSTQCPKSHRVPRIVPHLFNGTPRSPDCRNMSLGLRGSVFYRINFPPHYPLLPSPRR